ncbi:MAG: hypothetical protein HKM89_09100 [Gemmatimonadales bacterium]|nr:hypothetical protein [Gemmatimonadales bacterium]
MRTQLTRSATLALLLAGGSLILAGCSETQALESELNAASGGTALVQHPVDLSGTWKVNTDVSDDPREMLGNRRGQGPRAGAPADSGQRGFRRPGGRAGRPGAAGRRGEGPRSRGELTITQTDETVTLSHGARRSVTLTPDGQPVTKQGRGGERQVIAKWEGSVLVVEHSGPRGGTMTRSFELSADGQQLVLSHKLEGGPIEEPVEFRIVFDKT